MTAWDVLNNVINGFPPVALTLLLAATLAAVVVFITGFARHGVNFLKYGFKQMVLDATLEKRFDSLDEKMSGRIADLDEKMSGRIVALDEKMSGRIADLDEKMSERIAALDEKMSGRIADLGNVLGTRIDDMGTRIDILNTRIDRIEVNHFGHLKNYLTVLNGILLDKGVIDHENKARLDNELRDM
jgi:hypothetical protein